MRKRKILVEFVGGAFPKKKKYVINEEGNKIILKPGQKGKGGAEQLASFDQSCLVPYHSGLFRTIKYKLLLKEGADKCISFAGKDVECPTCSKNDVGNYGNATVIKLAGALKPPFNMGVIYILLGVIIVVGIIGILVSSGRIHF